MKRFWHRFVITVAVVLMTAMAAFWPAGPAVADSTTLPVQAAFSLSLPNGGPTPSQFQIPEGKRLVIEQVTIHAGVPTARSCGCGWEPRFWANRSSMSSDCNWLAANGFVEVP